MSEKKVITVTEIMQKQICLSESDITTLNDIVSKIELSYIDKCLLFASFINDVDADEVRNYNRITTKNAKDIRLARYFWIYLLSDNGSMTLKQIATTLKIHPNNVRQHVLRFESLLKTSELIKTKYITCLELLQYKID